MFISFIPEYHILYIQTNIPIQIYNSYKIYIYFFSFLIHAVMLSQKDNPLSIISSN